MTNSNGWEDKPKAGSDAKGSKLPVDEEIIKLHKDETIMEPMDKDLTP